MYRKAVPIEETQILFSMLLDKDEKLFAGI